jgi:hypothetical protein
LISTEIIETERAELLHEKQSQTKLQQKFSCESEIYSYLCTIIIKILQIAETNRVERHGGKAMRVFRPKEFKHNL